MGRIKTKLVKNVSKKLIKEHSNEFSPEFEKNKEFIQKYTNVASKKMRNVIAGYCARLIKQRMMDKGLRRRVHEEDFSRFYE